MMCLPTLTRSVLINITTTGHAKTVEYGHFGGEKTGTIRIHDGAETIHAMLEAHEFETNPGYPWAKLEHWILKESDAGRPARFSAVTAAAKLQLKPADAGAIAVFDAVKHDAIAKVHELHKKDAVHHTHIMDKAAHIAAYKLILYGVREVDYGHIYFGKIKIGEHQFIHVRAHKYHDASKPVTFHSIRITRDTGVWGDSAELCYFDE
ncbi:hypothetical protein HK101_010173 [Irineochytrium annulatum]|nr:hypothetical protein HK101_010173 [Irineochytrium annulatum]